MSDLRDTPGSEAPSDGHYRIAAVSSLTGIPVPTIRIWEQRYGAVRPARSEGNSRLYARADVERLRLLKAAVDSGFQIGTVATLSEPQLRERLQSLATPRRPPARPAARHGAVVVGEILAARLATAWEDRDDVEVKAVLADLDSPADAAAGAELLIVEAYSLSLASMQGLRRLRARLRPRATVLVYGYGNRRALAQLDEEGVLAVNAPADAVHLARVCRLALAADGEDRLPIDRFLREPAAPARYDRAFLAKLIELPTQVQCECPNHLAELLAKLAAFEQYSLDCESRNEEDAALHARLNAAASHCRYIIEHVLDEVLRREGIAGPA